MKTQRTEIVISDRTQDKPAWARLSAQSRRYEAVLEMQPRQNSTVWMAWYTQMSPILVWRRHRRVLVKTFEQFYVLVYYVTVVSMFQATVKDLIGKAYHLIFLRMCAGGARVCLTLIIHLCRDHHHYYRHKYINTLQQGSLVNMN